MCAYQTMGDRYIVVSLISPSRRLVHIYINFPLADESHVGGTRIMANHSAFLNDYERLRKRASEAWEKQLEI